MTSPFYDIVLLTESRYDQPAKITPYITNVLLEDALVQNALTAKGLQVMRTDWANPDFNWSKTRYALFRTVWDYFHRFEEFSLWFEKTATQTQFLNPFELIRWNMDKHYLSDLSNKGINITPTIYAEAGENITLTQLYQQSNWTETVLKPSVSGGGRHTYRINAQNVAAHEAIFQELLAKEAMMLQEFQHQVLTKGEVAMMVIGGKFTHAIQKIAQPGEFRVQDDFGGTVHPYTPSKAAIEFAEKAIAACPLPPLYARVDWIWDNADNMAVIELEMIEPELWFRFYPKAAHLLADEIVNLFDK